MLRRCHTTRPYPRGQLLLIDEEIGRIGNYLEGVSTDFQMVERFIPSTMLTQEPGRAAVDPEAGLLSNCTICGEAVGNAQGMQKAMTGDR
jgi:hypothetical protein